MPAGLYDNLYWIIPAAIILVCVVWGFRDVLRFSSRRVLAIADACFVESIRRKVLLVTPLAILGLIVVVQLQEPASEQDAIHQTARFCLFASGLLVAVTAIILACTNLPREIENRVIYTIVTKPTTRLEIVLGKIVGFAGVSAAILLIMGVFTWGYLQVRNWELVGKIRTELKTLPTDSPLRPTVAYYANAGLLTTRSLDAPSSMQVYSRAPGNDDRMHYSGGGVSAYFIVPFALTQDQSAALQEAQQTSTPLILKCDFQIVQHKPSAQQLKDIKELGLRPRGGKPTDIYGPFLPNANPVNPDDLSNLPIPQVKVRILDRYGDAMTEFGQIDDEGMDVPATGRPGYATLKPEVIVKLIQSPRFALEFSAVTPAVEYGVDANSVSLFIPNPHDANNPQLIIHPAIGDPAAPNGGRIDFQARASRYGEQLVSRADGSGPVSVFHFQNVAIPDESGQPGKPAVVPFQIAVMVERSGEFNPKGSNLSRISLQIFNHDTGRTSDTIILTPELDRANYIDVPRSELAGGNFDLLIRGLSPGQLLDVKPVSVAMITANRSFAFNLFKSLFILWMLSVLVVVIAVFCSTFLSWPIAVVLTLVI
ncbi:MAG TPA: hypothetical protein VHY37_12560, partial [Tepidisphaeraceae bacterium]|nr:hypothetical protein [Tepidisphaeraceae bacterium]